MSINMHLWLCHCGARLYYGPDTRIPDEVGCYWCGSVLRSEAVKKKAPHLFKPANINNPTP